MRLLNAWRIQAVDEQWPIIQTAIDDLESFHWLLIWAIAHILKSQATAAPNPRIKVMLTIFSDGVSSQASKESMAEKWCTCVVFGDLIRDWLKLFRDARNEISRHTLALSEATSDGQEREEVCNELEQYCMTVYQAILESGFSHLQKVKTYDTWNAVLTS
jgi:hypothetical protein